MLRLPRASFNIENSWLVFTLNLYVFSIKRQQIAFKKVYCIGTGLSNAVGFGFSPNTGKLLENLVFLSLRQQNQQIFYYYTTPSGYEVDFYLPEKQQLVQVTQSPDHPATRERELGENIKVVQAVITPIPKRFSVHQKCAFPNLAGSS